MSRRRFSRFWHAPSLCLSSPFSISFSRALCLSSTAFGPLGIRNIVSARIHRRQFTLPSRRAGGENFLPIRRASSGRSFDVFLSLSPSCLFVSFSDSSVSTRVLRCRLAAFSSCSSSFQFTFAIGGRNIRGMRATTRLWKSKSEYHFSSFLLVQSSTVQTDCLLLLLLLFLLLLLLCYLFSFYSPYFGR